MGEVGGQWWQAGRQTGRRGRWVGSRAAGLALTGVFFVCLGPQKQQPQKRLKSARKSHKSAEAFPTHDEKPQTGWGLSPRAIPTSSRFHNANKSPSLLPPSPFSLLPRLSLLRLRFCNSACWLAGATHRPHALEDTISSPSPRRAAPLPLPPLPMKALLTQVWC